MTETQEIVRNDMQVKINLLVAELEKAVPYISIALAKSSNNEHLFYEGMSILDRIELLSKWKED